MLLFFEDGQLLQMGVLFHFEISPYILDEIFIPFEFFFESLVHFILFIVDLVLKKFYDLIDFVMKTFVLLSKLLHTVIGRNQLLLHFF